MLMGSDDWEDSKGWGDQNIKEVEIPLNKYEKKIVETAIPYTTTQMNLFWYLKKTNRTFFDFVCHSVEHYIDEEYLMLRTFGEEKGVQK